MKDVKPIRQLQKIEKQKRGIHALRVYENIHDTNFKYNFEKIPVAQSFLRRHVDQEILEKIDLSTLEVVPKNFLPSYFQGAREVDMLYRVYTHTGESVFALLHLEGQSTPDPKMAIRLLEYHVAIFRRCLAQGLKIPLVLSFVLYNGKRKWVGPISIAELFEDFELYIKIAWKKPFLIDLNKKKYEELADQGAAGGPLMVMKTNTGKDFSGKIGKIYKALQKYSLLEDANIDYMSNTHKKGVLDFFEKFGKFDPVTAEKYRTMFQRDIAAAAFRAKEEVKHEYETLLKSIQVEALRAREEDRKEAIQDIALQMLSEGESIAKISRYTALTPDKIEELKSGLRPL